jgi:hypothetical protein
MTIREIINALSHHQTSAKGSASNIVNAVNREWFDGYVLGLGHAIELLKIWEITEDTKVAIAHGQEVVQ